MRNSLKESLRGEINIDPNAWHYHLYKYWLKNGGHNKPGYKENLCHYVRVVLLWTPLFWYGSIRLYKEFRLWMPTAIIGWVAVHSVIPGNAFLQFVWGEVAICGLIVTAGYYLLKNKKAVNRFFEEKIGPAFEFVWEHRVSWFFTKRYFRYVSPWLVAVVASLVVWGIFSTGSFLVALLVVGLAIVGLTLIFAILFGIVAFFEQRAKSRRRVARGNYQQSSSTLQIAGHYVVAKKHKICPFINLPEA